MNQPCQIPLEFYAGETFAPTPFLWINSLDNPIDLTNFTATMTIRQSLGSQDPPLIVCYSTAGQVLLGGTLGTIQPYLTPSVTGTFPNPFNGVWDLWMYDQNGVATRLLGGPLSILQPVTRP